MSDLATIQAGWDKAARQNAMANILTDISRTPKEFFTHGVGEIDTVMERLDGLGLELNYKRALDFGCGVGRLTQALAIHFDRVDGVDISPEMVKLARVLNAHDGCCTYCVNDTSDLALFDDDTFDFVYTMVVLQHMPSLLQKGYVEEFMRVLQPGGVAVFQIPEGPDYTHPDPWLSMWGTTRDEVRAWVSEVGAEVVDVEEAWTAQWLSCRYTVVVA